MSIVEARRSDGTLEQLVEVNLTNSGAAIMLTDNDGHQIQVHKDAWDGIVKAVHDLFVQENRRTHGRAINEGWKSSG